MFWFAVSRAAAVRELDAPINTHTHNPILCARFVCAGEKCDFASYYFLCVRDVSLLRSRIFVIVLIRKGTRSAGRESCRANEIGDDDDGNNDARPASQPERNGIRRSLEYERQSDRTAPERIAINKLILRKSAWLFLLRGACVRRLLLLPLLSPHTRTDTKTSSFMGASERARGRAFCVCRRLVHCAQRCTVMGLVHDDASARSWNSERKDGGGGNSVRGKIRTN